MSNGTPKQKPRVIRDVPHEWDEIMRVASSIQNATGNGEILISIHQKKVELVKYTIKRKPQIDENLEVIPLA